MSRWRFRAPDWLDWAKWGLLLAGAIAAVLGALYTLWMAWEERPVPPDGGRRPRAAEPDAEEGAA